VTPFTNKISFNTLATPPLGNPAMPSKQQNIGNIGIDWNHYK
jgi:hypothetical protein